MASLSGQARIAPKYSQLGATLNGNVSLYNHRGSSAVTPTFIDDKVVIVPANGVQNPSAGSKVTFNLPKSSTLIGQCWIKVTLTPAQTNPNFNKALPPSLPGGANPASAEYVKNVGDLIFDNHSLQYGNSQLQNFDSRFVALFRRLCRNDVNIEATNAQVLGNLPPSTNPQGTEAVLIDALYNGVTIYAPLEELFFAKNLDEMWMPEAYALEVQTISLLTNLGQIINTSTRDGSVFVGGGAVLPTIQGVQLQYTEVTLSAAEKDNRLKIYRSPEGLVNTWMDLEYQKGVQLPGNQVGRAPGSALSAQPLITRTVQLNNLRMDMAELVFAVHRVSNSSPAADFPQENGTIADWSGSYMEGDTAASILQPGGIVGSGFSTLIPIESFTLKAAGKMLYSETMDDFWNRTTVRKSYHKDSQIVGAVYTIPFARFPEDSKNATGFMSASVLGVLTLDITYRDPGNTIVYALDLYDHCYNLMQSRAGGVVPALK